MQQHGTHMYWTAGTRIPIHYSTMHRIPIPHTWSTLKGQSPVLILINPVVNSKEKIRQTKQAYSLENSHVVHDQSQFFSCGILVGQSEGGNDLRLFATDIHIVILRRNVDKEEVVGEETCADVADVGETDTPPDFVGGGVNVIDAAVYCKVHNVIILECHC